MLARLVVPAVALLALFAGADSLRDAVGGAERAAVARPDAVRVTRWLVEPGRSRGLVAAGTPFRTRVVRPGGGDYLGAAAIERAFPVRAAGPLDIARVAVGPDGTVVVAAHRFPLVGEYRSGLELWSGRKLVRAFLVPAGAFAGGLGFSPRGDLVATMRYDGRWTLYDRRGRRVADVGWTSRPG
jgi:hypothetical protein